MKYHKDQKSINYKIDIFNINAFFKGNKNSVLKAFSIFDL